eukprot:414413-Amphidinium_carterae.1
MVENRLLRTLPQFKNNLGEGRGEMVAKAAYPRRCPQGWCFTCLQSLLPPDPPVGPPKASMTTDGALLFRTCDWLRWKSKRHSEDFRLSFVNIVDQSSKLVCVSEGFSKNWKPTTPAQTMPADGDKTIQTMDMHVLSGLRSIVRKIPRFIIYFQARMEALFGLALCRPDQTSLIS